MDTKVGCRRTDSVSSGEASGVSLCVPSWFLDKQLPPKPEIGGFVQDKTYQEERITQTAFSQLIDIQKNSCAHDTREL
jgi:hypothetical protein